MAGNGLVFMSGVGTALDAANVRRAFRRDVKAAGLSPAPATAGNCVTAGRLCLVTGVHIGG
jgi:hypothetical protein